MVGFKKKMEKKIGLIVHITLFKLAIKMWVWAILSQVYNAQYMSKFGPE